MAVELIVDVGSCWGNSLESACNCVSSLVDIGIKKIKFQFCSAAGGNKPLPYEYLKTLCKIAHDSSANVSASVWDDEGYIRVVNAGCNWVKFAHSANNYELINFACNDERISSVYVTKPLMDSKNKTHKKIRWLWTYEINGVPVYPATSLIHHAGMYARMGYDGFSSHCVDIQECVKAHEQGASVIEVHANPLNVTGVPDAAFALTLCDVEKLAFILKHPERVKA